MQTQEVLDSNQQKKGFEKTKIQKKMVGLQCLQGACMYYRLCWPEGKRNANNGAKINQIDSDVSV